MHSNGVAQPRLFVGGSILAKLEGAPGNAQIL